MRLHWLRPTGDGSCKRACRLDPVALLPIRANCQGPAQPARSRVQAAPGTPCRAPASPSHAFSCPGSTPFADVSCSSTRACSTWRISPSCGPSGMSATPYSGSAPPCVRKRREVPGNAADASYARKNWPSVVLFNCACCRCLTPEAVSTASGLHLHQFRWLEDHEIGPLPPELKVLVGVQPIPSRPRNLHYTLRAHGSTTAAAPFPPQSAGKRPCGPMTSTPESAGLPEPLGSVSLRRGGRGRGGRQDAGWPR